MDQDNTQQHAQIEKVTEKREWIAPEVRKYDIRDGVTGGLSLGSDVLVIGTEES